MEKAIFANGCFWCTEAIFKMLIGVVSVTSGYCGGNTQNPNYESVSEGASGHAECVEIVFDPKVISYNKLLDIFWHTHNPTTLNQQGNDIGTQYRSVIFYVNEKQKQIALKSKEAIEKEGEFNEKIVTEVVPYSIFYPAEEYHKNFYQRNTDYPYCNFIIMPKIQKLLKEYKKEIKEEYLKYEA